jgi:AraC family transcriptional regulator
MSANTETLLSTPTVIVRDAIQTAGAPAVDAPIATMATLVFPYRGVFVRHIDKEIVVAEPNQVLFFNANEPHRIAYPLAEGAAFLLLEIDETLLGELAPAQILREASPLRFAPSRLRIDPRAQALVAMLRYSLREAIAEPLEAESLALTLAQRALGPRTTHEASASASMQKLVDRVKLVLTADLARRWTLAEIAAEVGGSPVYLTQAFRQVEAVPLYRYQLRLRLAKALDLMGDYEDLSALGHELGFSSHSHFSAAFKQAYGRTPTEFRQSVILKQDR